MYSSLQFDVELLSKVCRFYLQVKWSNKHPEHEAESRTVKAVVTAEKKKSEREEHSHIKHEHDVHK